MFNFDKLHAKLGFFVKYTATGMHKGNFTPSDPPDTSVILQAKTFSLSCMPVDMTVARVGRLLSTVFLINTKGY